MINKLTKIYAGSSIGNTHIAKQSPNQDSVGSWVAPDGVHFCVAISDGHGSAAHPYSEYGSKFAVASSLDAYKELFEHEPSNLDPLDLFQRIISSWSAQCIAHFAEQNLEVDTLKDSVLKLYGATLCIAYVSGDTISVVSLGDSTAYFRNHSGHYSKFLIHDDSPGEATFSLCQSNPLSRVEVVHIPYSSGLIILSTDGIIKSLKCSADYVLIADYYMDLLKTNCSDIQLFDDLSAQLESFSRDGSGDDCTLALIYIPALTCFNEIPSLPLVDTLGDFEEYSSEKPFPFKKKVSTLTVRLLLMTGLLLSMAILASVILYSPIKNHLLFLIRSSLCSKEPNPVQPQNLMLQLKRQ